MPELTTAPTFTFKQGDIFNDSENIERPITVTYYNGSIELSQDGDFDQADRIIILPVYLDKLLKEIKKHLPEATRVLSK